MSTISYLNPDSPPDWAAFRRRMPVTENWAYLDHAAVAPITGPSRAALIAWANESATSGDTAWSGWDEQVGHTRSLAARLIGAHEDEIALVRNTTEGIGLVAEGIRWEPGDNVVTLADEFPSNQYPWMNLPIGVCRPVAYLPNGAARTSTNWPRPVTGAPES